MDFKIVKMSTQQNIGSLLFQLQRRGQLCNLMLRAGASSAMVHSCVLAVHCPQFVAQLQLILSETPLSQCSPPVMQLGNNDFVCESRILHQLVAYLYGQQIQLSYEDEQCFSVLFELLGLNYHDSLSENNLLTTKNENLTPMKENSLSNELTKTSINIPAINSKLIKYISSENNPKIQKEAVLEQPVIECYVINHSESLDTGENIKIEVHDDVQFDENEHDCLLELTINDDKNCGLTVKETKRRPTSSKRKKGPHIKENSSEELLVQVNFNDQHPLGGNVIDHNFISRHDVITWPSPSRLKFTKPSSTFSTSNKKVTRFRRTPVLKSSSRTALTDISRARASVGNFKCGVCEANFRRCPDLVQHVRELQHFSNGCPICDFQSSDLSSQTRHFSLHDSPLPFFCCGCDLRFRTRAQMAMHLPKHSNIKPFSCSECGRAFKWRHALQAHMLRHRSMGHLLCDICGFSSNYLTNFKAHLKQHTGQAFKCPHTECTFKAFRKGNLKAHLITHSKLRPHQCDVCGNSFSLARNLSRHMRLHNNARLRCDVISKVECAFATTRPDKLRSHLDRKHNMKQDGSLKFENAETLDTIICSEIEQSGSCIGNEKISAVNSGPMYEPPSVKLLSLDKNDFTINNDDNVIMTPVLIPNSNTADIDRAPFLTSNAVMQREMTNHISDSNVSASSDSIQLNKLPRRRNRKPTLTPLNETMKIVQEINLSENTKR